jgi:hypothetical protein
VVPALPDPVAEHDHRRRPGAIFVLSEMAADDGINPEHRKQIPRDESADESFGIISIGHREGACGGHGDRREAARLRFPILELRIGHAGVAVGSRLLRAEHHQRFGILERQRPDGDDVRDAEDGAVDADTHRQTDDGQ